MKRLVSTAILFSLLVLAITPTFGQARSGDIAIVGGTVVTMDKDRRVIENGAVVVRGEKIAWVGKRSEMPARMRRRSSSTLSMRLCSSDWISSFARASREGRMSGVSIDRDRSTARRISRD